MRALQQVGGAVTQSSHDCLFGIFSPLGSPGPSPPPGPAPATPRFTAIRRSESVSRYLEQYSEKRAASCGDTAAGCNWTRR